MQATHDRDVAAALDQDGQYRELEDPGRRRELHVHRHPDESATLSGQLTAECAETVDPARTPRRNQLHDRWPTTPRDDDPP